MTGRKAISCPTVKNQAKNASKGWPATHEDAREGAVTAGVVTGVTRRIDMTCSDVMRGGRGARKVSRSDIEATRVGARLHCG